MKKKSYELAKLENKRWSIFTNDLKMCYFCRLHGIERPAADKHEIIGGSNRRNSMRYGYVLPLCRQCHDSFTNNHRLMLEWAVNCQEHFYNTGGTLEEWLSVFHTNYKYKLKKIKKPGR